MLQGDPDKVLDPYIKGKGNARALSDKALEASGRQEERGSCLDIIILCVFVCYIKGKGNARALSDKALEASGGQQERGCLDIIILLDTYIYKHNTPSPPPLPFNNPTQTDKQTTPHAPPPTFNNPKQTIKQTPTPTNNHPPPPPSTTPKHPPERLGQYKQPVQHLMHPPPFNNPTQSNPNRQTPTPNNNPHPPNHPPSTPERLGQYKQPVAFAFTQLFTDKGALANALPPSTSASSRCVPHTTQSHACSDER